MDAAQNGAPATGVNPDGRRSSGGADTRLRALVLLAGSVRQSDLGRVIHRSLLDLPVEPGRTVLSMWQASAEALAAEAGLDSLPIRVAIDRAAPEPQIAGSSDRAPVRVERDASDFRGTGGVLRDLSQSYAPSDVILVANAAQILIEPLTELAADLFAAAAAVSLIGHGDGTPGGLFLVRCSVLRDAAGVGFLDFKEQLLPRLAAAGHDIRVIPRPTATALPVRTLDGYIAGLRAYHRMLAGSPAAGDPFAEDWSPTFAIREAGAIVESSATIHDSVVLSGGRVERSAAIVRSVVGPGGVVRAGQTVADQVIGSAQERRSVA